MEKADFSEGKVRLELKILFMDVLSNLVTFKVDRKGIKLMRLYQHHLVIK